MQSKGYSANRGCGWDRIYGVLGWIGLAFVVAGTIAQIVGNVL
jgi:hypothetical protein